MSKLKDKIFRIVFGDVVGRGITFATTIYIARTLGADAYGLITVALSFLGYATWVSDLGLLKIGTREMAKKPSKRIFRAKEIFIVKVLLGTSIFALSFVVVPLLDLPETPKKIISGFLFCLIPYSLLMEWYYNGKQFFGKTALSKIANSSLYLVLVLLFIKSSDDIELVPFFYAAGISTGALILGLFSLKEHPFQLPSRGWPVFKDLLASASTIGIGAFFAQLLQLLPPLVIGLLLSTKDAGIYGAAIRIVFIGMMVDRIIVQLLLPNLSSQWLTSKAQAKENLEKVIRLVMVIGGVISLGIAIASPKIIELVYGLEYEESGRVLSILTVFLFFTFLNSIFSFSLIAIGKDRQYFYSTLFGGIISAVLIFGSTVSEQLLLVVAAVSLSEIVFTANSFYHFKKNININMTAPLIVTLLACSGLFWVSEMVHFPVLIEGVVSVFLFLPLLLLFNVINMEHLTWLKTKLFQ